MNINTTIFCQSLATPTFSNVSLTQAPGREDTARIAFAFSGAQVGNVLIRFTESYVDGDGKAELAPFVISVPVEGDGETFVVEDSQPAFSPGSIIHAGFYYDDGEGGLTPAGNAVELAGPLTMQSVVAVPSQITPATIDVPVGTAAGTIIGQLAADQPVTTWGEGTPALTLADISTSGAVSLNTQASLVGQFVFRATATNSAGTYQQNVIINVFQPTQSEGFMSAPNANSGTAYTSIANLASALDTLEASFTTTKETTWGLDPGDTIIIGLDVNTTSTLDLRNYDFPEKVIVRGVGTLSRDGFTPLSGTKVGHIFLDGSTNLIVQAVQSRWQSGDYSISLDDSVDCGLDRCVLEFDAAHSTAALANRPVPRYGIRVAGTVTRPVFTNCAMYGAQKAHIMHQLSAANTGMIWEWNVHDQEAGDVLKSGLGTHSGWSVRNCIWGGRLKNPGSEHYDGIQIFDSSLSNSTFEYLVQFWTELFGSKTGTGHQMFWWGGGSGGSTGNTVRQCSAAIDRMSSNASSANSAFNARYCEALAITNLQSADFSGTAPYYLTVNGMQGFDDNDFNFVVMDRSGNRGQGANGIGLVISGLSNGAGGYDRSPGDWVEILDYFDELITLGGTVGQLKPKSGARTHWNHANPVGPYLLKRKMFDDAFADHHKLRGWPIDAAYHITYDPNNLLALTAGPYTTWNNTTGVNTG